MNEEQFNMELRKFLKKVGITSQREIEQAVRKAWDAGKIKSGVQIDASMQLRIPAVGLDTTIDGTLRVD
ncbi:MAG: hypothetical protein HYY48_00475 [Gammaproteobacteria bacterium]|nr:hypothetical protein [Gammaproteobacteria bacterium]